MTIHHKCECDNRKKISVQLGGLNLHYFLPNIDFVKKFVMNLTQTICFDEAMSSGSRVERESDSY